MNRQQRGQRAKAGHGIADLAAGAGRRGNGKRLGQTRRMPEPVLLPFAHNVPLPARRLHISSPPAVCLRRPALLTTHRDSTCNPIWPAVVHGGIAAARRSRGGERKRRGGERGGRHLSVESDKHVSAFQAACALSNGTRLCVFSWPIPSRRCRRNKCQKFQLSTHPARCLCQSLLECDPSEEDSEQEPPAKKSVAPPCIALEQQQT